MKVLTQFSPSYKFFTKHYLEFILGQTSRKDRSDEVGENFKCDDFITKISIIVHLTF